MVLLRFRNWGGSVNEWVKLADAAAMLGVPYRQAYDLALGGSLESRREGAGWRVSKASVEQLAAQRAAR